MESKKATSVLSDIMQKLSSIGKPEEVKEEVVELSEEVTETEVKEEEVVEAASTEVTEEEVVLAEEEDGEEIVEEVVEEIVEEELDEEMYVSREEFENAIADIKAMFIEVSNGYEKEKLEMSAQIEDLSKAPATEPLSHSPEAELSTEKKVLFSQKRRGSTMDRVLSKMNRK
jgi:restriction endonuclease Mrr